MLELFRVFVALWALLDGAATVHEEPVERIAVYDDESGLTRHVPGYMECHDDGTSDVWIALEWYDPMSVLVHELAHAYDCADDGEMNGSPMPEDGVLRSLLWSCRSNAAERYACWVVESSRAR